MKTKTILLITLVVTAINVTAQTKIVPIKYGDMEQWVVRYIKESRLLGGQTKTLYVLAPTDTIRKNAPFDFSKTCWGISNAYAAPAGIDKGACTTQPEKRGNGTCARLDTKVLEVKVLGCINLEVCVAGTLFLGANIEPVTSASDPYGCIPMGIPFTTKPKALMLDVKAIVSPEQKIYKATGLTKPKWIDGHDEPEIYAFLEKRWETADGKIHAVRIATAYERINKSIPNWENNHQVPFHYGDITKETFYKDYMGLFTDHWRAKNSKGKMVNILEEGWGTENDTPTHVILMITAGCYPAFYGHPGNSLWIDNVKWVY